MGKKEPFKQEVILIDGKCYRVADYPSKEKIEQLGEKAFVKGMAYRYITDLQKRIYPYHGIIDYKDFNSATGAIGIYHVRKKNQLFIRFIYPKTQKEREAHSIDKELSVAAAVMNSYYGSQFIDPIMAASDAGSTLFIPPMHSDDDALNRIVKLGIRMKGAPFEPYGKRLESLAVEKKHGMEGVNIKNNTKRGIKLNRAMSPSKGVQYADVWQFDIAFIIKDQPEAMHPFSSDGSAYIYYPNGIPFEIDPNKLINAGPLIEEAILNDSDKSDTDDENDEE